MSVVATSRVKRAEQGAELSAPKVSCEDLKSRLEAHSVKDLDGAEALARDISKSEQTSELEELSNKITDIALNNMLGNDAFKNGNFKDALTIFSNMMKENLSFAPKAAFEKLHSLALSGYGTDEFIKLCGNSKVIERFGSEFVGKLKIEVKNTIDMAELDRGEPNAKWSRSPTTAMGEKEATPINATAARVVPKRP